MNLKSIAASGVCTALTLTVCAAISQPEKAAAIANVNGLGAGSSSPLSLT
jgi:hypothetical protein